MKTIKNPPAKGGAGSGGFAAFRKQQAEKFQAFTITPQTVIVPQGFTTNSGYANGRVLATDGLATCVGVALVNPRGAVLAHIDSDGEPIASQIAGLLLQLMDGAPTQIHISSGSDLVPPSAASQQTSTTRIYSGLIGVLNHVAVTRHASTEFIVDPRSGTVFTKFTLAPTTKNFTPGVYYWNIQKHPFRPEYRSDPFA